MAYIEKRKPKSRERKLVKVDERQSVYRSALWRKLRRHKLETEPLCEVCGIEGRVTAGEHVHHLRSFVGQTDAYERDRLAYDPKNLMTVCARCHARIHGGDLQGCHSKEEMRKRLGK